MTGTAESPRPSVLDPSLTGGPPEPPDRTRWRCWAPAAVLVIGLVVTGVLAWLSADLYSRNEQRLLDLRGRELGAVLAEALPNTQTPLASAAALAEATSGNPQKFTRFIAPYVGSPPRKQFVSVSLWRMQGGVWKPLVVVGSTPALTSSSTNLSAFFGRAVSTHTLTLTGILKSPALRLGYAVPAPPRTNPGGGYVAYGEGMIPANRRSRLERNQAFSELNYAIYLGRTPTNQNLLVTSLRRLPVRGTHSTLRIPFGDTALTLVVGPREPLAGTLPERLPWIILIAGIVLSLGASLLTLRLQRAVNENRRMYAEQRTIAETLQHALLPDALPRVPGVRVSGRYQAAGENVEVGGDWYDLIPLDEGRVLLLVGDVSGRGLAAATAMAALRFAIHAYIAEGDPPDIFLPKLSRLLSVTDDRRLATVLCAVIDTSTRQISLTSAGHLPPLISSADDTEFVDVPAGLPVGVDRDASYASTTITAPPGATLLAFTDGLVERRGESIEIGLERLRAEVNSNHAPLDQLLTHILGRLAQGGADDT